MSSAALETSKWEEWPREKLIVAEGTGIVAALDGNESAATGYHPFGAISLSLLKLCGDHRMTFGHISNPF